MAAMALLRVLLRIGCVLPLLAALVFAYWKPGRLKLDFVNCDIMENRPVGRACEGNPLLPRLWTPYFYDAVLDRAREIWRSGRYPVLVHIGASDFEADMNMYEPLVSLLRAFRPRLVLAEPQTRLLPVLMDRVSGLRLPPSRLAVVAKAVAPDCARGGLPMYGWSERLQEFFTRRVPLGGYTTHDRDHLFSAVRGAARDPDNYWSSEMARVAHLDNLTEYIEEQRLECANPTAFLAEAGVKVRDIAAMVIDAEGLDNGILERFLLLTGFQPALVMHETPVHNPRFHRDLWRSLKARGYAVGATANGMNVVSVQERLFRWPRWQGLKRWLRPFVFCDARTCEPAAGKR